MRKSVIIGILFVLIALIGFASGDVYEFTDSYGNTYATGQVTFDENGLINGGVIAGATNGDVNVEQSASQGDGSVSVSQSGEIQGDYGFAGTLAADGNGNSGGNFASVTGGSMSMDQETVAGQISSGDFTSEGQSGSVQPVFTASGLVSDQVVEMEGGSGYAGTLVANANGASAQADASFTSGGMDAIQGGAVGGASLVIPYYQGIFSTSIAIPDFTIEGAVAGQGADIWGSSGSASTTVSDGNGASGQSVATFSNGGMDLIQAGGAGIVSVEGLSPYTGYEIPAPVVPGSLSLGGVVAGQSVYMGGSSGSASTTVSGGNGASGQTVASFTGVDMGGESFGGMEASQAGAVGEVSLVVPYYESAVDFSSNGVIAGQVIDDLEGGSGSASTTISDGYGATGRTGVSFDGGEGYGDIDELIQAGGAGGVALTLSNLYTGYSSPAPSSETLDLNGAIIGQYVEEVEGASGSASTTVSDGNGASGRTEVSFAGQEGGEIEDLIQAGGAGGVSLALSNLYTGYSTPAPSSETLNLNGVIIGQYVEELEGSSGSASTTVSDGYGATGRTEASFTGQEGGEIENLIQAGGTGGVSYALSNLYTGYSIPAPSSETLDLNGVIIGQALEELEGTSGSASTTVSDGNGAFGQAVASFNGGEEHGDIDELFQAGGAGGVAFMLSNMYPGYSSPVPSSENFTFDGVIIGQYMEELEGSSGSASTTVSDGYGATGRTEVSFSGGEEFEGDIDELFQAGGAGRGSYALSNLYSGYTSSDPSSETLTFDGVIIGQYMEEVEGASGSASTTVSDGNGTSGTTSTSFTNAGIEDLIQAGAAGDVFISSPFYTTADSAELSMGGVIVGQDLNVVEGASGSASTTVTHQNGASAQSLASFTDGKMGTVQAGAAGDASLLLPVYLFEEPIDVSLGVDGVIAGQDFYAKDSGSASALTSARDANGNYAQANASVSTGNLYTSQVAGAGDADLGLAFTPAGSEEELLGLSAGGIFSGQAGKMIGSSGSASTEVDVSGTHSGNYAEFTEGGITFSQLSAGITRVNLVSLSDSDLSGVLSLQSVESNEFSSFAAGSFSDTAGNSHAQVNATAQSPAQGSGSVGTTQFAGSIAYEDLNAAIAGQDVYMENVGSGSAGGSASDAAGNSAVLNTYVTSGNLEAGEGSLIPMGILAGAGDLGGISGAVTAYTDLTLTGESGGLSLDSRNPRDFTSIQSAFSNGGTLESGIGFTESDGSSDVYHSYMDSNATITGNPAADTSFQFRTGDFDFNAIGSGIGWQNNDAMCEQESGPDYRDEYITVHIRMLSP